MGKLSVGDIPGYSESLSREIQNREVAYLGVPFSICGISLRQMTPQMMATLYAHGSPFLCGGKVTVSAIIQFLWACSVDYSPSRFRRWRFFRRVASVLTRTAGTIDEAVDQIDDYTDATFQDAPRGGRESIPYASQVAWLHFELSGEPWRMSLSEILDCPLRIIYQQLRCRDMSKGITPINPSDRVRQQWVDSLSNQQTGDS